VLVSLALLVSLAVPVSAVPIPHSFYGTLTIVGDLPAPPETEVTAVVEGGGGSYTTSVEGQYGSATNPFDKLVVSGEIEGGALIEFYVNGAKADQTATFFSGRVTELNLTVGEVLAPVAGFSASPLTGIKPLTVVFTDESENMINNPSWSWDFGDEETSTEQNPTHEYLQDGSYTVTLTVTTDAGTDDEVKADYIVVADIELVASFTADPTSGEYPLEVSFTDTSTSYDGIISWEWDFSYIQVLGFNVESTDQNPSYTYTTEGINSVALRVTEADDDSDMMVAQNLITVTPPTPPTVVSTSPLDAATNVAVDATVSATFDEDIEEGANFGDIAISGATGVSASIDGATLTIAHDDFDYETSYTVTIPAGAVNDLDGNPLEEAKVWSFTTGGVVPPSIATITLPAGWNLLSTPIKLDADSDALEQIFDAESQANIEASFRWDTHDQEWKVPTGYELSPLEAVYLKVSSDASATAELRPCQELSGLPWRELQPGLNLIGPAPALGEVGFPAMPLDQALVSIAEALGGLTGYTIVVSPAHNQPHWSYALGGEIQDLLPFKGYWVVMENADTLYGFSTTPIP